MHDAQPPRFRSVNPILAVKDLPAALDYYQRVLGFELGWVWGDPATLASVCRDDISLNLSADRSDQFGPSRLYAHTGDIDTYHATVVAAGARVTVALDDRVYGMRDFRLVDPDGNELSFGEPITT